MARPLTRWQLGVDVALAGLFTGLGLLQLFVPNDDGYYGGPLWLNIVLTVVITSALAVRRVWPIAAAVVPLVVHLLPTPFTATASSFWGMAVPLAILMYGAARWGDRNRALAVLALPLALFPLQAIHVPAFREPQEQVFPILLVGSVWAAGRVIHRLEQQRRDLDAALAQVAVQQEELNRRAVQGERQRIAREMHDVVAHGVSVMIVQAGSARTDLAPDATAPRDSLLAVEGTGREVLGELRRIVSLLRHDEEPGTRPSPGLADLPDLAEAMQASGLAVSLALEEGVQVDPGRELASYRVVQEALTNALRHSGRTRVEVRVGLNGDTLCVQVEDDGPPPGHEPTPVVGGGHGLAGLRERIALYGGCFEARRNERGFVVCAGIPLDTG